MWRRLTACFWRYKTWMHGDDDWFQGGHTQKPQAQNGREYTELQRRARCFNWGLHLIRERQRLFAEREDKECDTVQRKCQLRWLGRSKNIAGIKQTQTITTLPLDLRKIYAVPRRGRSLQAKVLGDEDFILHTRDGGSRAWGEIFLSTQVVNPSHTVFWYTFLTYNCRHFRFADVDIWFLRQSQFFHILLRS